MGITPEMLQLIREEHAAAPYARKSAVIQAWAGHIQCAPATLYRELDLKARRRVSKSKNEKWRDWARVIAMVKRRPPEENGELTTEQAREIATGGDIPLLPPEAADVPVGTYDRIMRELGYSKRSKRVNRFQAEFPNQAHHIDASSSAFLYVHRQMPDGEYILRLHRKAQNYKNKPTPCDRLRWWYYGMVDDHSGVKFSKGIATHGENGTDGMEFCIWAWERLGVAKKLLGDEGPLKKGMTSSGFVKSCGVDFPPMTPYEKNAHGKVETTWKSMWKRFELQFFAGDEWQKFEIAGSELNRRLMIYNEKDNERRHRFERKITRMDAWRRVSLHGGLIKLPDDVLARAAHCYRRKVDVAGCFSIPGWPIMEVIGLHDAWVFVYEAVFEDKLVVKEIATGNMYGVRPYKILNENEFRGHIETPHQIARREAALLHIDQSALLFQQREAIEPSNLVRMPIRETVREVADVFDVEHYASIEEAMAEFDMFLPDDVSHEVRRRIEENGLSKEYIQQLAQEFREIVEVQKAEVI